jgi:putative ABC transport system permease protein
MTALVLRGMLQRRLRSVLTGLAILLGVAMIAGTYVQTDQIKQAFNDIEETANAGNDVVVTAKRAFRSDMSMTPEPFDASALDTIRSLPGVAKAEGQLYESGALVEEGERVGSQWAPGIVVSSVGEPFDPLRYRQGGPPRRGEVTVNTKLADDQELRVGQTVQVATRSGVQEARLAGVFDYGDVASIGGATMIVAPLADVQRWYDAEGTVTGIVVAARDGVSPDALASRIANRTPEGLQARTGQEEAQATAKDINDQLGSFLTPMLMALAGAALLVGAFIIFNTFSITVAQRSREIALLRSIGATRRQIVASVTGEALILGSLASALGLVAGIGFAKALGALFDAMGFGIPRSGIVLAPRTIIVSLAVGIGVTVLAALVPAMRATRVAPVAALTGESPASPRARRWTPWVAAAVSALGLALLLAGMFGGGAATQRMASMAAGAVLMFVGLALTARYVVRPLAAVLGWPIERAFGVPGRLARENAQRNPARTASTSAALMVGLGLVVFVAVFASGLKASLSGDMDELMRGDYIATTETFEPLPAGAGPTIANVAGVRSGSPQWVDRVEVNGSAVNAVTDTMNGVDPVQFQDVYRFRWQEGGTDALVAKLTGPNALVEREFAKTHGIEQGETFTVETPSGGWGQLDAIGFYDDPMILGGIVVAVPTFRALSSMTDPYSFIFKKGAGWDTEGLAAGLNHVVDEFPSVEVLTKEQYEDKVVGSLDVMVNMLYALLAMSVVISLFGIANSLFLAIHERTREFGMLRAIGSTAGQVKRIVRYESVITAVLGGIMGIGIGILFAWLMTRALGDLGLVFSIPVGQLGVFLLIAVVVGIVGAILPARRGARTNVLEALHYE